MTDVLVSPDGVDAVKQDDCGPEHSIAASLISICLLHGLL